MKRAVMILSIAGMMLSSSVFAAIIRVPSDQPTIQAGIDAAVDGDTVLVADGTYTGDGNRDIDFKGKAITVASENGADKCIIDCQASREDPHRGLYFHSGETLESIVKGFMITHGVVIDSGGGVNCTNSSPSLVDCIISENVVDADDPAGGGISCINSSPSFTNCIINGNDSGRWIASSASGGGIYCSDFASPLFIDCVISENEVHGIFCSGAGVFCWNSSPVFVNSIIVENSGAGCPWDCTGGGLYSANAAPILISCIIAKNVTKSSGGGIYCDDIYLNKPLVVNSIVWSNVPDQLNNNLSILTYCDVQGGYAGIGNIDADPLFLGVKPFDFHPSPNSPCIDAGTNRSISETDLNGNPRLLGGAVDIGAYEYPGWPSIPRAYINMPSHEFKMGDTIYCSSFVWNPEDTPLDHFNLFVVLDAFGQYYFAPGFSSFDYFKWSFSPGKTEIILLPETTWPSNMGSASGLVWYAALVNPEMTELVGGMGVFDFGWSE